MIYENLNPTVPGKPYPRLCSGSFVHTAHNTFEVHLVWQMHMSSVDNCRYPVGQEFTTDVSVTEQNMNQAFEVRNPSTGEPLGVNMTHGQLVAGFYSRGLLSLQGV